MKNINILNCVRKINHAAKYCGRMKKESYNRREYELTRFYKDEQRKLYLLKAMSILYLEENGALKRSDQQKDISSGTILEAFSSDDGIYNFHSISIFKENENASEYKIADNDRTDRTVYYMPYMRHLIKILPEKYCEIYNILTCCDFYFPYCQQSVKKIERLKELGVMGEIYKSRSGYYDDRNYYCNMYLKGIEICKIIAVIDCGKEEFDLTDKSGYIEYCEYIPFYELWSDAINN